MFNVTRWADRDGKMRLSFSFLASKGQGTVPSSLPIKPRQIEGSRPIRLYSKGLLMFGSAPNIVAFTVAFHNASGAPIRTFANLVTRQECSLVSPLQTEGLWRLRQPTSNFRGWQFELYSGTTMGFSQTMMAMGKLWSNTRRYLDSSC
jgi:hypothetical protein